MTKKKKPLNTAQQFGLIEDVSFLVDILYDSKKKKPTVSPAVQKVLFEFNIFKELFFLY